MVLLIIIPFLNGYFIGKINPIFRQTQILISGDDCCFNPTILWLDLKEERSEASMKSDACPSIPWKSMSNLSKTKGFSMRSWILKHLNSSKILVFFTIQNADFYAENREIPLRQSTIFSESQVQMSWDHSLVLILQVDARADRKVLQVVRLDVAEDHRIEQHLQFRLWDKARSNQFRIGAKGPCGNAANRFPSWWDVIWSKYWVGNNVLSSTSLCGLMVHTVDWIRPHRRCWGVIFRMALVKRLQVYLGGGGGIFRPKPPVFDRSWRSPSKNTVKNSTEDTCSWTRPSKIGKRKVKKPRVFQLFDLNFLVCNIFFCGSAGGRARRRIFEFLDPFSDWFSSFCDSRNTGFYSVFLFSACLTASFKTSKNLVNYAVLCYGVNENIVNTSVFWRWLKKHCKLQCFWPPDPRKPWYLQWFLLLTAQKHCK